MRERNQAPEPGGAPEPGAGEPAGASSPPVPGPAESLPIPDPALPSLFPPLDASVGVPGGFPPPFFPAPADPAIARARRGLLAWFFTLLVFGVAAIFVGQIETAALVALGALLAGAHAAEIDARSRISYQAISWVVPLATLLTFAGLAFMLGTGTLQGTERTVAVVSAGVAAIGGLLLLAPPVVETLARFLFSTAEPRPIERLTTRLFAFGVLLATPAWFSFDAMRETLLAKPEQLTDPSHLSGGLVGYILVAVGGVGWLVRRTMRQTLQRLGIQRFQLLDVLVVVLGVAVLVGLNAAGDAVQHRWLPGLWRKDHDFTKALAGHLAPLQTILLGVSAGVGEEITLRGGLQPRLGILLTSLFFAVLHFQYSWYGMLMILLLGITLGIIRQRRNTTVAIAVHAVYDVLAVFGE